MKKLKLNNLKVTSFVTKLSLQEKQTIEGAATGADQGCSTGCESIGAGGTCVLNSRCCPTTWVGVNNIQLQINQHFFAIGNE